MATVVNNPQPVQPVESSNNNTGYLLGLVLLIVVVLLFFYYGLPLVRGAYSGYSTTPQVSVPGKVDVNINHSK